MRNPAAKGRKDANQALLVKTFERMGCEVQDTSAVGDGFPDLAVSIMGRNELVECKTESGKFETSQRTFYARWKADVYVARTPKEVVDLVNYWRRRA